jgi:S1-C subfamily serine protease
MGVERNSPAELAGLAEADLIVALDDHPIASVDDLHAHLTHARVGVRTPLTILRHGERLQVTVVPDETRSHVKVSE